jgi:hypothetical protein
MRLGMRLGIFAPSGFMQGFLHHDSSLRVKPHGEFDDPLQCFLSALAYRQRKFRLVAIVLSE